MITFQSASSNRFVTPLDLQSIFWKSTSLPKDIVSITGFKQSIGGKKPAIQKTSSGIVGERNAKLKRIEIRFKFRGIAVIRESTVTLSGSVPWEMIYRVTARLVPEVKSLHFEVTNTAVRFYLKKQVRIEGIADQKRKGSNFTLNFDPDVHYFPRLLIRFSDGVVASIFANGTVVAQGKDLKNIESRVRGVLNQYKNPYGSDVKKAPIPARKNLARKRKMMTEARYELANSWNNTRNGYYVRPGPNKRPRFYQVPKNPALVRQKVLRAYSNIGVNVPNNVKRLLGIVVTAVKPKAVTKKTLQWNANVPNGFYIRPGPGGLPKMYKVPKLISQGKKTVIKAYKNAGVNIPKKVKNIFSIANSPVAKSVSPTLKANVNSKGKFRVDGLDCMRYKLEDLKRIATKIDIPTIRQTKTQLCAAIRLKLISKTKSPPKKENFTKNGVKYYIHANNKRVQRNKRSKAMNSFKIEELKNMIKLLNNSANISALKKKSNYINMLIERKRTKNELNKMFNSPISSNGSPSSSSSSSEGSPPARNPLNIARNILGPNFSNSELKNFLNQYMKLPTPNNYNSLVKRFKNRKTIRDRLVKERNNTGPKRMMKVNVESL